MDTRQNRRQPRSVFALVLLYVTLDLVMPSMPVGLSSIPISSLRWWFAEMTPPRP